MHSKNLINQKINKKSKVSDQHRTKPQSQQIIMERGTKCLVQQKNIIKATYKSAPYPDPTHHIVTSNIQSHTTTVGGVVAQLQQQITQPSIINNASQLLENVVNSNSGGSSNLVIANQQTQPQPPASPSKTKLTRNRRAAGRHESRYTSGKIYILKTISLHSIIYIYLQNELFVIFIIRKVFCWVLFISVLTSSRYIIFSIINCFLSCYINL